MNAWRNLRLAAALVFLTGLGGCGDSFTEAEKAEIVSHSLAKLPRLPADPTNRYADDPAAAALGATLFFDTRMSRNGQVACGTCHVIDTQFQDGLPLGKGVATTNRRTMPLAGAAWSPFQFWDGRRDSLWAQALTPLEDQREHAGTRTGYAHFMHDHFGERFERIFGKLPDLSHLPAEAGPFGTPVEQAAWRAMSEDDRLAVDRVYATIGKSIAAFERSLVPSQTRFDHFADAIAANKQPEGDAALTPQEIAGLRLFMGKGRCSTCHTGPRFTDDGFHNTGVPPVASLPADLGRATGVKQVAADPFNCMGKFSDAGPEACGELRYMVKDGQNLIRAYKTPSLRGVATRPPYMHAGQFSTLENVLDHYSRAPASVQGVSELHPVTLSERERAELIAFLKTISE